VDDVTALVAELAERVRALEDELAIRRVIAAYGPAVDGGDAAAAAALWTKDAVYDMDVGTLDGAEGIAEMVVGAGHQEIILGGSAHNIGPALVEITGDTAAAITYSQLFRGDGDGGFFIWRVAANRWDLDRTPDGWRIRRRFTRLLDGRADAREILRRSVGE
jgi:ketosteroid isomerase-like protein